MIEFNKLSEGYDFLEESVSMNIEPLSFQSNEDIVISEAASSPSPYKLLGKVKGVMAPIGEFSRNGRLYESSHWHTVLSNKNLQDRIQLRRCFGTISHANKKVDDEDFKAGNISHIVSCLEVRDDDNGRPFLYGELDILDTPAGRILEAMYRGGAGLYVSTRAAGKLMDVPGQSYKLVNSQNYYLESIDFVLNPGFLAAKPVYEGVSEDAQVTESIESEKVEEPTIRVSENKAETNEDVQTLKAQVEQLTKILEKMVEDVYEPANEEVSEVKTNESLADFVKLMADTNISEEAFSSIIDMLKGDK